MPNFIPGSKYNETLTGSANEDRFYGSPGNDTLDGGGGIDTVDYSTLQGNSWPGFTLMSGIEANLAVGRVTKFFVSYATGSTKFFTFTDVLRNIENLVGTGLSDLITGSNGNNMLDGGAGDDTLFAGAGNDNLLGQLGNDVLYGEGGDDRLDGGADNDTMWGQDGNDTLDGGDGNDQLSGGPSIDVLKGGKGINVDLSTGKVGKKFLVNKVLTSFTDTLIGIDSVVGTAMNDVITGNGYANILRGGAGNDTMAGGLGSDIYRIFLGDGVDVVQENDRTAYITDVLEFGVNADRLWFSRVNESGKADNLGINLQVSILGTADKVTVQNWYLNNNDSAYHVEQIKSGDGKLLLDMKTGTNTTTKTDLELLVQAMASFAPPSASQTSLTSDQIKQLTPVLAGTWSNWLS